MIVVDASALAAFVLREEGWEELSKYMARAASVDNVVKEVSNAIWKASCLRGFISARDAVRAYMLLRSLVDKNITLYGSLEFLSDALEISLQYKISIYDSLYLALALKKRARLLTLDERQADVAKRLGIEVLP
ncbi:MAG TPA: PIN domain-containing protein [Candidatus Korarchaeota archaeon]|nr:PIN domain-containing protein [Candidatus Korarchaeota archaeon]